MIMLNFNCIQGNTLLQGMEILPQLLQVRFLPIFVIYIQQVLFLSLPVFFCKTGFFKNGKVKTNWHKTHIDVTIIIYFIMRFLHDQQHIIYLWMFQSLIFLNLSSSECNFDWYAPCLDHWKSQWPTKPSCYCYRRTISCLHTNQIITCWCTSR